MRVKTILPLFKEAAKEFSEDKAPRLSAALAYYTLFAIAPLLVISIAIAGFALGEEAARGEIVQSVQSVVGTSAGKELENMILNAGKQKDQGIFAAVAGIIALLFGASGVFGQLKESLNTIWEVPPKKGGGFWAIVRQRFLSFTMVLGVGFLLLISLVITSALSVVGKFLSGRLPGGESLWLILNAAIAVGVISVLFAMLFKYLPDAEIKWSDVWTGAVFTAVLFAVGKFAIGFYLGKSSVASTYGAAGSLVIILVWIYYSGLIFFFGAEFTEVYSRRGAKSRTVPSAAEIGVRDSPRSIPAGYYASSPKSSAAQSTSSRRRGAGVPIAAAAGGLLLGVVFGAIAALFAVFRSLKRL